MLKSENKPSVESTRDSMRKDVGGNGDGRESEWEL